MYIKLMHPNFGEVARRKIERGFTEESIKKAWKYRYGKKLKECTFERELEVVNNQLLPSHKRKLVNIKTGEFYRNQREASKALKISETMVRRQLLRNYQIGFDYILKYAE